MSSDVDVNVDDNDDTNANANANANENTNAKANANANASKMTSSNSRAGSLVVSFWRYQICSSVSIHLRLQTTSEYRYNRVTEDATSVDTIVTSFVATVAITKEEGECNAAGCIECGRL